ncbi:MAG: pyridoxamine kinase [Candidatus Cloacimonadota bacterium]|nr:pyridoxamine kinase [Candidatus Cloacimonadota bacterium]
MINPIQRVAAIHDLSGFGKASLTVVIPILSSMGIQVCPLPTAVLSTHSKFPDYYFVDLTEHIPKIIEHWKKIGINFNAIYSGFLGSPKQIDIVKNFIKDFSKQNTLVVIDPVLGDDGKLYGPLSSKMVPQMKSLIKHANIITPNLTEASLLLGKEYIPFISTKHLKEWLLQLSQYGPQIVIVTSVPSKKKNEKASVVAYNKSDGRFWKVSCDYLPTSYPGTGDTFASVIVGCLLQGDSLPIALDRAVQFISMGVRSTFGHSHPSREGIFLERILPNLKAPVQTSSYELLN